MVDPATVSLTLVALCTAVCELSAQMQSPAGASVIQLRVIRIAAGPAGSNERSGKFLERSIFNRSDDHEVIVLFQWDKELPGAHKLVAQWRSPDGGRSSSSAIDYVARDRRFGGYWRLALAPTTQLGTWSIDVTVDGQPAGRHTFEVRGREIVAVYSEETVGTPELYEQAGIECWFVVIERSTASGRSLGSAAYLLERGRFTPPWSSSTAPTSCASSKRMDRAAR